MQTSLKFNFLLHIQHDTCPLQQESVSGDRNSIGVDCEKFEKEYRHTMCAELQSTLMSQHVLDIVTTVSLKGDESNLGHKGTNMQHGCFISLLFPF
jgi:hypothetical protein